MLQFRDFCLTINNEPRTDKQLYDYIKSIRGVKYFVFQREKGTSGTEHIQLYIEYKTPRKFESVKRKFPRAHIEDRRAKKKSKAREYCMKEDTRISGPYEFGKFNESGYRSDLEEIYDLVKNGATDFEIMELYPTHYMRYSKAIQECRQTYTFEKFRKTFRKLQVNYIWGPTGCGKSSYIIKKYGFNNVYRVTNYRSGAFDSYAGQDVIVFEEFRNSFSIKDMLNYLDGYPLQLPCRYADKVACYTKVYIITNIPLQEQYKTTQTEHKETWKAFLRRINNVFDFDDRQNKDEIKGHSPYLQLVPNEQIDLPF